MIEAVKYVGNIIDELAYLMRCKLSVCTLNNLRKLCKKQAEVCLTSSLRCDKILHSVRNRKALRSVGLLILVQDGFDTDNCIENIRACISLK